MKLLLTHRYFWPDTAPYALMLRTIGDDLADAGHDVHVFASKPSYRDQGEHAPKRETLGRLNVRRSWVFQESRRNPALRAVNVLLYCAALFFHVLRLRPDVVMASTFPPVIAGWTASLVARLVGARFVYHMMDIHPEVSFCSGGRLGRGMPAKFLKWLDNNTLRRSDAIVTLSSDMVDTLIARGLGPLPVHVINNLPLDARDEAAEPPVELRKRPGAYRVIFAGNLGRFQNLSLLAEGVARCFDAHPDLELFFLGDGVVLPELKKKWGDHPRVGFGPFLPFSQARGLIAEADVGVVSLLPGVFRVAYPSKVLTYLSVGLPVLALVEQNSELAHELEAKGWGIAASEPTPEAVAFALEKLLHARERIDPVDFRKENLNLWLNLFAGLEL